MRREKQDRLKPVQRYVQAEVWWPLGPMTGLRMLRMLVENRIVKRTRAVSIAHINRNPLDPQNTRTLQVFLRNRGRAQEESSKESCDSIHHVCLWHAG